MKQNLAECFFRKAEEQPDHPLILGQEADDKTSYGEFRTAVEALAQQLQDMGIRQGDNIGLQYPTGGNYIAFVYAIWTCGACVTPIPLELTPTEKQQIFEHVYMDAAISHTRMLSQISDNLQAETLPLVHQAVFAKTSVTGKAPSELADINAAFIRFSSGTTGSAKGVVLSHEAIYIRIHAANKVLNIDAQDRVLFLLSMDYQFAVSICSYISFGASIILPKNSFGVTLLSAANNQQASIMYGSPTHYMLMAQDDNRAALPAGLRLAIVTTTALSTEAADTFYQRFGRVLNETYGLIEVGLPAINTSQSRDKQGSIGQITPGYELYLEPQEGQEYGEIMVRGDGMLDAYYSPWRSCETMLAEQGGWFKTGDLGKFDDDGFLYIVGRSKEMINIGGMKFFPAEVEAVLEKHPAIDEACVFSVREQQWGETAHAHLVLLDGETAPDDGALRSYCRQSLPGHKIPGRFHWVTELAYTASGKKIRNPDKLKHS